MRTALILLLLLLPLLLAATVGAEDAPEQKYYADISVYAHVKPDGVGALHAQLCGQSDALNDAGFVKTTQIVIENRPDKDGMVCAGASYRTAEPVTLDVIYACHKMLLARLSVLHNPRSGSAVSLLTQPFPPIVKRPQSK